MILLNLYEHDKPASKDVKIGPFTDEEDAKSFLTRHGYDDSRNNWSKWYPRRKVLVVAQFHQITSSKDAPSLPIMRETE